MVRRARGGPQERRLVAAGGCGPASRTANGSGIAFLLDLLREGTRQGARVTITNLAPRFAELLGQFDQAGLGDEALPPALPLSRIERLGRASLQFAGNLRRQIDYALRVTGCLWYELRHRPWYAGRKC